MPAEYTIDKARRMVFSKAYGIINDQEVYAHQDKLRDDPDFDPDFWQLIDSTNVEKADGLSTEAFYRLARRNPFGVTYKRIYRICKSL